MTDPRPEIADIIIDCVDPESVARFWADLLQRPIAGRKGPYVWLRRTGAEIGIGFQRVAEPKAAKNRVHMDISGPDVEALRRRVEALGGSRPPGFEDGGFLVLADPEGNEFCAVPVWPIEFDDLGRTDYQKRV
ncbi:MAG: VOC family protein [Acidimicrobiales bacterium]